MEGLFGDPAFDAGAALGAHDEADWNIGFLMNTLSEEIADGGEIWRGFWRAGSPGGFEATSGFGLDA